MLDTNSITEPHPQPGTELSPEGDKLRSVSRLLLFRPHPSVSAHIVSVTPHLRLEPWLYTLNPLLPRQNHFLQTQSPGSSCPVPSLPWPRVDSHTGCVLSILLVSRTPNNLEIGKILQTAHQTARNPFSLLTSWGKFFRTACRGWRHSMSKDLKDGNCLLQSKNEVKKSQHGNEGTRKFKMFPKPLLYNLLGVKAWPDLNWQKVINRLYLIPWLAFGWRNSMTFAQFCKRPF